MLNQSHSGNGEAKPRFALKVLAVDDSQADADYLRHLLSRIPEWEVEFLHAADGEEARDILGCSSLDVVFLDYRLGAESGLEVLQGIRAADDIRAVIALTGQGDEVVAAELTRAGADDYVVKSDLGTDELRRSVRHALSRYQQRKYDRDIAHRAEELRKGNEKLREIDELKTKFLSEVSHELRTPLASIISAARIIQKHFRAKPDSVPRFTNTIISEGNRLTRLINDFLDLAKIESGCSEWRDAPVDAAHLLEHAVRSMHPQALERGVSLRTEVLGSLPQVMVDADRVSQVLTNLLSNAVKFTPKSGSIVARAAHLGATLTFSVQDTGPGIPVETQETIFDRYHQLRDDTAPSGGGTGLGLAICKEIVEHYGGRIWVDSTPGSGSTFSFSLPATGTPKSGEPHL